MCEIDVYKLIKQNSFDNIRIMSWEENLRNAKRDIKKWLIVRPQDKPIYMIDKNLKVIERFDKIIHAAKKTWISRQSIWRCCKWLLRTAGWWSWNEEASPSCLHYEKRPILKCDLNGNVLKEYDYLKDVTKDWYSVSWVSQACSWTVPTYKTFIRYKNKTMASKRGPWRPKIPKSQHKKRDRKREYKKFKSSPAAKKKATLRKRDRRAAIKSGKVKKWDNTRHVHHSPSGKIRVISAKRNLWMKEKSRLKGSKRNKKTRGK